MNINTNISSLQTNQKAMDANAKSIASDTAHTNLAKEIPNEIVISNVTKANVDAIKTENEMMGSLLNLKV